MDEMIIKNYIYKDLILKRFKDKNDLKKQLNSFFNNKNLKVKEIEDKSYYDNNFEDYSIMVTVGTDKEDIYDITIYYAKTRINENVIIETNFEKI